MWMAGIQKFRRFKFSFLLACIFASSLPTAHASVWTAANTWSDSAEESYAVWVQDHWKKEFFLEEGHPYSGMRLDCADAVLAMRIIFAAEHGYPIRFRDPTGGKHDITEKMTRFDQLAPEKRLRKFLQFVFETMGTINLPDNSYPVAINRTQVRPGALLLSNQESHHAWTIKEVSDTGVPYLIHSRQPKRTVLLTQRSFPSNEFLLKDDLSVKSHAGYRAFRRPEDIRKPVWQVPGYSEEQYSFPLDGWSKTVQNKLAIEPESPEQELDRLLVSACETAEGRALEVRMGLEYLAKKPANYCYTEQEFYDYSTPSYDYRLRMSFKELQKSYEDITTKRNYVVQGELAVNVASVLNLSASPKGGLIAADNQYCPVEYAPGKVLSLGEIRSRSLNRTLSHNPHDPIEYRWGEKRGHSARATKCPSY